MSPIFQNRDGYSPRPSGYCLVLLGPARACPLLQSVPSHRLSEDCVCTFCMFPPDIAFSTPFGSKHICRVPFPVGILVCSSPPHSLIWKMNIFPPTSPAIKSQFKQPFLRDTALTPPFGKIQCFPAPMSPSLLHSIGSISPT